MFLSLLLKFLFKALIVAMSPALLLLGALFAKKLLVRIIKHEFKQLDAWLNEESK